MQNKQYAFFCTVAVHTNASTTCCCLLEIELSEFRHIDAILVLTMNFNCYFEEKAFTKQLFHTQNAGTYIMNSVDISVVLMSIFEYGKDVL